MKYSIGDKVLCKKNRYTWLSRYWLIRIFKKEPDRILKKNEVYYVLQIDEDGIPNTVTYNTEKDFIASGKKDIISVIKNSVYTVLNNLYPDLKIGGIIAWGNIKVEKNFFKKYFHGNLSDVRRNKLKKLRKF